MDGWMDGVMALALRLVTQARTLTLDGSSPSSHASVDPQPASRSARDDASRAVVGVIKDLFSRNQLSTHMFDAGQKQVMVGPCGCASGCCCCYGHQVTLPISCGFCLHSPQVAAAPTHVVADVVRVRCLLLLSISTRLCVMTDL
jgi:hypothetical protein